MPWSREADASGSRTKAEEARTVTHNRRLRSQIATSKERWGPQRVARCAEWWIEQMQMARWS
jgi:hypothetical protein